MKASRVALWLLPAWLLLHACADDDDGPDGWGPGADVGAPCSVHADCPTGTCCTSPPCGGMCTYECRDDRDCPYGTLCEGGKCFWSCRSSYDCAPGYSCKHDHTVCQR